MSCLIISPEIQKLQKALPNETLSSIANMVGLWQEREMARGNKDVTIDSIPAANILRDLYDEVRASSQTSTKLSKEDMNDLLVDGVLPNDLVDIAKRLGIQVSLNKKTREISISSERATKEDIRLFRALAIDLYYLNGAAVRAFQMESPHERLAAIIDWESKNKKGANKNLDVMNYELQLAKRNIRDIFGLSTDGVMESLRKQAAMSFTSKERLERIAEITDWFDRILSEQHETLLNEIADRQDQLREKRKNTTDDNAIEAIDVELAELQQALTHYASRLNALKDIGPKTIFDEIKKKYSDLLTAADDNAFIKAVGDTFRVPPTVVKRNLSWYKEQAQKVVDNFIVLSDEACKELEVSELVHITISFDDATSIAGEKPFESENTDGEEEGDVNGLENEYKETWMYEYDTASNWSKMSARVRHMLYRVPLGKRSTRFGTSYHRPVMEVVNTLIQEMQGITNSRDMQLRLEQMEKDYDWVHYIREQIAEDPQIRTELFRVTRRYAQTLGSIERIGRRGEKVDMTKANLKILNSGNTVNSIYTSIQNQLSSGVPVNKKLSIYKDDVIDIAAVDKALDILDKYSGEDGDRIASATAEEVSELREEYPELISDIHKILTALGVSTTESSIRMIAARDIPKGTYRQKNNLAVLLSNSLLLLQKIKENNYEYVEDLLEERRDLPSRQAMPYYKKIAEALTLCDTGAVEASIRERGKVRYSYVLPSVLDDLITGLQGKRYISEKDEKTGKRVLRKQSIKEFIESQFGEDPRFSYRMSDGELHYHNYILETLAHGDLGISTYGPQYVTVLNADTASRDKIEQKDMTQNDRLNMMWSMYHMSENAKYPNAQAHWYPIPLPSDSGRIAYISFVPVGDDADQIIKTAIIQELERMTDPQNAVSAHLPNTYKNNAKKFCTFPVLNDESLAGYSVSDIIDTYMSATGTAQYSDLDKIIDDLVDVVKESMVGKFKEENSDFYDARVKDNGEEAVANIIIDESLFQMAINEILNGDPAYYTGYNKGSDNIQKRAKQSIVPLDHMDIYNEDFQEAYKAYHGIDPDTELEEEEITEDVLYITDPEIPSPSYDDLVSLYDDALANGIIDRDTYDSFIESSKSIKYTDGQAFRSFESMKMMMYALGEMKKGDELDQALDRIASGTQVPEDAYIIRTALKPFLSGLIKTIDPDGTVRLMPVQHKLSEQVLTAALVQASGSKLGQSPALKALSTLMRNEHLDAVIFTSGVKVGNNGSVNFEDVDVENSTEETILAKIYEQMDMYRSATGLPLVHYIPYSLYGIVAQNPETDIDDNNIPIGVQLQKLLAADLPDMIPTKSFDGAKWVTTYEKATYPVAGIGDLTRDEIIALYNKLMTEKILREYNEVTGTFADKERLSEALMRSCRNSSRNSGYLERAFSLDEYGNFVIPLCDLATLNMSSEFLNSIVKNAVSRITAPGKQLVSMSAFGFAKELKIEFEYDEDGAPIRYKGIECLLPAWSRHIVEKCSDENGVLDFDKLEKESPSLAYAIGVRVPTQFKNFILPLKCVGFLPTILGDTIVTAIDSVVLQDSDFDNDKVPTIFPSFKANYYIDNWERKAFLDYKKYCDQWYNFDDLHSEYKRYMKVRQESGSVDVYSFADYYHDRRTDADFQMRFRRKDAPEGEPMMFWEFKEAHKDDYLRPDGPKLEYVGYNQKVAIDKQSDDAINNGIISVMYGMLTGRAVSTMSLASGSTAKLKPIKELIEKNTPKTKYPDSPSDISTRISQETRNNDGKQMIAVFANAESIQAILQHSNVSLAEGTGVVINGRGLLSLHDTHIENSIEYISRYIGTALGAAADNAKDPMLSVMNINLRTAPVVSLMLQLGYTMEEVALFLNIPSIRHFTDTGNFGSYEAPDANDLAQVLPGDTSDMLRAIRFGDNYDDMEPEMAQYCNTALSVFAYLSSVGERLRRMSSLMRGDSGGSSPHGPIENNLVRYLNYELFAEQEADDPLFDNWREVVDYPYDENISQDDLEKNPSPLAQAYISYGVVGAFQELSKFYPGIADPNFRNKIKDIIKKYYGGVATVTNVKNIMYALYTYIESAYDCVRKDDMPFEASRNYYLNVFPEEAARLISTKPELSESLLFRRLKLYSTLESDEEPFITLNYDGTMLPATRDEFTAVWQQMFYDEDTKELALDLFKYCFYRNGFRFADGSFAHLAPAEARLFWPGYVEMLESMQQGLDEKFYENFELQFVRNNLYDGRFCMTVPVRPATIKPDNWLDENGNPNDHVKIKYRSRMDEAHQKAFDWYFGRDKDSEKPRTAFVITRVKNGEIQYFYYVKVNDNDVAGESTYALTTPLGWKDKAVEYSAKESGIGMPSAFDQSEVAESLRPKKKRRGGSNKTKKSNATTGKTSNSSEAPNETTDDFDDFQYMGFWASFLTDAGYKEALVMNPSLVKSKKYNAARTAFLKDQKAGKFDGKKTKSKQQISKEKSGGKKTSTKFHVIEDGSIKNIADAEARCAREIGAYTISITDSESEQLGMLIHSSTSNDTHYVADLYEPGNAYKIAGELAKKLRRKTNKSIVLNLTGSYINTLGKYASQDDIDGYVLKIYKALKDKGIYISKVVTTAQPGIPLASARAAVKLGYALDVHPTGDYKVYTADSQKPVASKDTFLGNIDSNKGSEEYRKSQLVYDKEEGPFITAQNKWTREIAQKDKKTLYVFTDNTDRTSGSNRVSPTSRYAKTRGEGKILSYPNTTSAVIRGLENAYPLSVQKRSPGHEDAQWTDKELSEFRKIISSEINDIIDAFESGEYKRVVLPVGGVFDGPIADISMERTPKLYKELQKQMEYLQDRIEEIADSDVNEAGDSSDDYESGLQIDANDILSGNEIRPINLATGDLISNVYVLDINSLADRRIKLFDSTGKNQINEAKLFVVIPTDAKSPSVEAWKKAKVYLTTGRRVTEELQFSLPSGKGTYSLLNATQNGMPLAVAQGLNMEVRLSSKVPYNKAGLVWLDDNNEPLC